MSGTQLQAPRARTNSANAARLDDVEFSLTKIKSLLSRMESAAEQRAREAAPPTKTSSTKTASVSGDPFGGDDGEEDLTGIKESDVEAAAREKKEALTRAFSSSRPAPKAAASSRSGTVFVGPPTTNPAAGGSTTTESSPLELFPFVPPSVLLATADYTISPLDLIKFHPDPDI